MSFGQTPNFIAPDTVCRGQNITITNSSTGQTTNLWNFCGQRLIQSVTGVNLGAISNMPNRPHGIRVYKEGNNWIGFLGNDAFSNPIRRLEFGNSLLNSPTITSLPYFGQIDIPRYLDFIYENGNWYALVISGLDAIASRYQGVVVLKFGSSLMNNPTILSDLGNLNGLIDGSETMSGVSLEKSGNEIVGFVTASNGTGKVYRIDFGTTITNPTPTYTNLGDFGVLKWNHFVRIVNVNGQYFGFTCNDQPDNNLIRFNFGNSLQTVPTVSNLGNPNNVNNRNYDLLPYTDCESIKLLGINLGNHSITSFSFPNGYTQNQVSGTSFGNIGSLSQPAGFSQVLIEGNQKYAFISNALSNTITRINIEPVCSSIGVASSTTTNPPVFSLDTVGTITVSLTINKNLTTEASTCQEIVILDTIHKPDARINTITCSTDSIRLSISNIEQGVTYSWTGPNGFSSTRPYVSIKFTGANQAGQYIVTATGRCGTKKDTVSFVAPTGTNVNLGRDTSICQGSSLTLNATTSGTTVSYTWSTGASTPTISVTQSGTYWVRVTADGCTSTDTIRITVTTIPSAFNLGNDTTYCGNFTRVLSTGNTTTTWSTGATGASITVTQPGRYIATITNTCGSRKDTINLYQNPIPQINLGRDTSICQGNSLMLNATTSGTTVSYTWSTGASTPTINVTQSGTYWVRVTADGCTSTDTIRITVNTIPSAFNLGNDTTYCGNFTRVLSTGNATTTWSTGATGASITVTQPGTYYADLVNSCGGKSDTIEITQDNFPQLELKGDTVICDGNTAILTAISNASQLIWNNGDTTRTLQINQHGTYWVMASNQNCSTADSIYIEDCEGDLWVPKAFTPNDDGINDQFILYGKYVSDYHLRIFDRWGQLLFESQDINNSWDGTYKGKIVQLESYSWIAIYKIKLDGKVQDKMKKGTVTVLK